MLMLRSGDTAPYADALLDACVENLQYDRQCEENRAAYMMRLLGLTDLKDRACQRVLDALPASKEGWDQDWMVDLLEAFASEGRQTAWIALRDLAAGGNERAQDNLATTDDAGLRWVVDNVLPTLAEDDRWRIGMWLPDEEANDVTPTQKRLRALDKRFDAEREAKRPRGTKRPPKADGFLRKLVRGKATRVEAIDFARSATPRQWRAAARRFLRERRRRPLSALVRAYRHRPWPLSVGPLFRSAAHPNRGWATMDVLGTIDTPAVRRFALGRLRRRPVPPNALDAIEASLRPGDERIVLAALKSVTGKDRETVHDLVLDTVALFREHPEVRWQPHAEWILEHSPCSMCRGSAVDWLVGRGTLPAWFAEEAPYDAEPDIRERVANRRSRSA